LHPKFSLMKLLKILLIIIVIFLLPTYSVSQSVIRLNRVIEWQDISAFSSFHFPFVTNKSDEKNFFFQFKNANYPDNNTKFPYFFESIEYPFEISEVLISNESFETIHDSLLSKIGSIDSIPNQIAVEYRSGISRKQNYVQVSILPLRRNKISGAVEKLVSFTLEIHASKSILKNAEKRRTYASESVLKTGKWVKIKVSKDGVYKITFDELKKIGISNPQNTRIFGNSFGLLSTWNSDFHPDDLLENKILIENESVIFYAKSPNTWKFNKSTGLFEHTTHLYSNFSYYFITSDLNTGFDNRISNQSPILQPANQKNTQFNDFQVHESDTTNLIKSGRNWYGEEFDYQINKSFNFTFPNLVNSQIAKAKVSLAARSMQTSSFTLAIGSQTATVQIPYTSYNPTDFFAYSTVSNLNFQPLGEQTIKVDISYNKSLPSSIGWLDFIELNVMRNLEFNSGQLQFRNIASAGPNNISEFEINSTILNSKIWDITEPTAPKSIPFSTSTSKLSFKTKTDSIKEFIIFDNQSFLKPITEGDDVGIIANQNFHGISVAPKFIIVCPSEFLVQANALADFHRQHDNMTCLVVTNDQVYNEFSSGIPDISAIRNFVKMFYDRANSVNEIPKYLLLFGDGSFDNKHITTYNPNKVLTYQSDNSLNPIESFVTDDYFALLDDHEGESIGLLDVGVGRLPAGNSIQASNLVNKIIEYHSKESMGDWRNMLCFIGDDEDYLIHMNDADQLAQYVSNKYPTYNIDKIYLDAYPQISTSLGQTYPEANLALENRIQKGSLILNYTGHANESWLAHEHILGVNDIIGWSNRYRYPLMVTATCEFSRFDNYESANDRPLTSSGELALLNSKGGAIALFSATRVVYSAPNFVLNRKFYEYIFETDNQGKPLKLGDVMRLTKNATYESINKRSFALLGDPASDISYASYQVETNSINSKPLTQHADTLRALQKVTIQGQIKTNSGLPTNLNGTLFPTVFDKKIQLKTLNNDENGEFTYSIQNNQIYKGRAAIINGKFDFTFIVPKDILYNFDTAKISYYATSDLFDAKGFCKQIIVGGSASVNNSDFQGPEVSLYFNDSKFVTGGITNDTPTLFAVITDSSGINTVSSGIGHEITAIIDNDSKQKYTLNEYYTADLNSFQKGKIEYKFNKLSAGKHVLKLKVWDIFNNSSETELSFEVIKKEDLQINHILNYPNPFWQKTMFTFEHNAPFTDLYVTLKIFSVSGELVKSFEKIMNTNGFRSEPIEWDGTDDFGNKIGKGVYFYEITVKNSQGQITRKKEKLLILK